MMMGGKDIRLLSTHMPGQPLEGPVLDLIPQVRNAVTASSKFQFSTDSPPLHDGYGLEGLHHLTFFVTCVQTRENNSEKNRPRSDPLALPAQQRWMMMTRVCTYGSFHLRAWRMHLRVKMRDAMPRLPTFVIFKPRFFLSPITTGFGGWTCEDAPQWVYCHFRLRFNFAPDRRQLTSVECLV